jgi:S1-C subfamily serine protease
MKKSVISFILGAFLTLSVGAYAVPEILSARFTDDGFMYNGQEYNVRIAAIQGADEQYPSTYIKVSDMAKALGGHAYSDGENIIIESGVETVAKNCKDSCVMIYAYGDKTVQGSGWVYNGYIVTAKHVIEGAEKIDIFIDDSIYGVSGTVHYIDPDLDVAILKADIDLPSVTLGDSDKLVEGQKLVAITSPAGGLNFLDECLFSGICYNRKQYWLGISDTLMTNGSSGGAVFNEHSELIGMACIGAKGATDVMPINKIKPILQILK